MDMGAALAMLTAFANAVPFSFLMLSLEETILNYICLASGDFNMNWPLANIFMMRVLNEYLKG